MKRGWFARGDVRAPEGETMPKPWEDEVILFLGFFSAGLRFPVHPIVLEVLKRFEFKFHQLMPVCFTKVFVSCGLASPRGSRSTSTCFCVCIGCTFSPGRCLLSRCRCWANLRALHYVRSTGAVVPVQAQKNKWLA